MNLLVNLIAWLRRRVVVSQPDPDRDVAYVCIDHGDGRKTGEVLLNRNNLFALAWCCREFHDLEKKKGPMRDVSFTLRIPKKGSEEDEVHIITIPGWAKSAFYRKVIAMALAFGWEGQCPRPSPSHAFR